MKVSEVIKLLEEAREDYGELPVVAMIGNYGDGFGEFDSASLETDEKYPKGCIFLE